MDIAEGLATIFGGLLGIIIAIPIVGGLLWLYWKLFVFISQVSGSMAEKGTLFIGYVVSILLTFGSDWLVDFIGPNLFTAIGSLVVQAGIISLIINKKTSWKFILFFLLYLGIKTLVSVAVYNFIGIPTV